MFVRNAWYVAAWDHEITRSLKRRVLLDEPVVLFRTDSGKAVALEDRCCHRQAPLSMGKLIGNVVKCPYHGLEFDSSGKCVKVPSQDMVPPSAKVRAYPMVEKVDASINHRRVRTLLPWFQRHWTTLKKGTPYRPGDVVFFDTFPTREGPDHLGVIGDRKGSSELPVVINNWTDGTVDAEMDLLPSIPVTHHFRIRAASTSP